jgi:hypothetical protein
VAPERTPGETQVTLVIAQKYWPLPQDEHPNGGAGVGGGKTPQL